MWDRGQGVGWNGLLCCLAVALSACADDRLEFEEQRIRRREVPARAKFQTGTADNLVTYSSGSWHFLDGNAIVRTSTFGQECVPAPADYDGDRVIDLALHCGATWQFYSADGRHIRSIWTDGVPGDIPVPADYDGDGRDDVVIYRGGGWIGFDYTTGKRAWGVWTGPGPGSLPLPMDHDGDGRADFTVYHEGTWNFYNADGSFDRAIWTGGDSGDIPVPADYDGEGREEPVIFRNGAWEFHNLDGARSPVRAVWTGIPSRAAQLPAPLDHDGDGTVDLVVFSDGIWFLFDEAGKFEQRREGVDKMPGVPISRRQHVAP